MEKVYIKWEDIFSYDPWIQKKDALTHMSQPCICETIGFILFQDEDSIIVCSSVNSEDQVCGLMRIPKGCIKELKEL